MLKCVSFFLKIRLIQNRFLNNSSEKQTALVVSNFSMALFSRSLFAMTVLPCFLFSHIHWSVVVARKDVLKENRVITDI